MVCGSYWTQIGVKNVDHPRPGHLKSQKSHWCGMEWDDCIWHLDIVHTYVTIRFPIFFSHTPFSIFGDNSPSIVGWLCHKSWDDLLIPSLQRRKPETCPGGSVSQDLRTGGADGMVFVWRPRKTGEKAWKRLMIFCDVVWFSMVFCVFLDDSTRSMTKWSSFEHGFHSIWSSGSSLRRFIGSRLFGSSNWLDSVRFG